MNFRYQLFNQNKPDDALNTQIFPVTAEYDLAMYDVHSRDQVAKVAGKFLQGDAWKICHKRVDLINSESELDGIAFFF